VLTVVGARPQFVKAAVVARAMAGEIEAGRLGHTLVHTGQHYDENMSGVFFEELSIPRPDVNLGVSGLGHGAMTGRMLEGLASIFEAQRPDWVLVYGDTNSTLAGALAASKLHIRVAHVEAGLRSFNRAMPEEINRVLTDHCSDVLFAPTNVAVENLRREGVGDDKIVRCGDVMLDAAVFYRRRAEETGAAASQLREAGVDGKPFALATVHRQENTDDPARLAGVVEGLERVAGRLDVVLPLHPRTRAKLELAGLMDRVGASLRVIEPVGYLGMLALESAARVILTDSGGVQKEAYFAGVPCVTLRDETEWTELVEAGANVLVGADPDAIEAAAAGGLDTGLHHAPRDLYGDGRSAEAIVRRLLGV